jgi:DNA-binding MurR/RpiR family transcriptional regulator
LNVGDATINRLCKKVGFSGFTDLKISIAKNNVKLGFDLCLKYKYGVSLRLNGRLRDSHFCQLAHGFCPGKKVGFSGFTDLKISIAKNNVKLEHDSFNNTDLLNKIKETLDRTHELIDN